jgi:hypothetical protein
LTIWDTSSSTCAEARLTERAALRVAGPPWDHRRVEERGRRSESVHLLKIEVRADDSFDSLHRDVLARLPGVQRLVSHFNIRTAVEAD